MDWSLENIKRGPRWLLLALHEMWLARRAAHWPTNEGTVQSVWLAPPEVLIVYTCRWEGKLYSGSIRRGTITGAERMLHTYPKGGNAWSMWTREDHPGRTRLRDLVGAIR